MSQPSNATLRSLTMLLSCAAAFTAAVSCKSRQNNETEKSAAKEFVLVPFESNRNIVSGFKLARVEKLNAGYAAKGIPAIAVKAERMRAKPKAEDPAVAARVSSATRKREAPDGGGLDALSDYHVVVSLGPLEKKEQWDDLVRTYGGEGNVPFEAGKTYQLTDFLNPKVQALMGRHFANQREYLPRTKLPNINGRNDAFEVGQVTNCFQAAYEALRGGNDALSTFFPDMDEYDALLKNATYSVEIKALTTDQMDPKKGKAVERNAGLEPGDAIMVYGPWFNPEVGRFVKGTMLGHIAIFLDDDLYFEKTGPLASHLYRVVGYRDMVMPSGYNSDGDFSLTEMRVRRFKGKPRLPPARESFSVGSGRSDRAKEAQALSGGTLDPELAGAPWKVLAEGLAGELNVVNQPGLGGIPVLWFYRIKESALEIDSKSKRYKLKESAFTPEAFWF